MTLQFVVSGDQIIGSLADSGSWTAVLIADRQVLTKSTTASVEAGNYTFVIPPDSTSSSAPPGYGFGTIKVEGTGALSFSGALADGTKVTRAARYPRKASGLSTFLFTAAKVPW